MGDYFMESLNKKLHEARSNGKFCVSLIYKADGSDNYFKDRKHIKENLEKGTFVDSYPVWPKDGKCAAPWWEPEDCDVELLYCYK